MSPQSQTSGLTVRQHEREEIALPMEFTVTTPHGAQVRFSPSSSASGPHIIRGEANDISSGGMGLKCWQFLPRMCEGTVRVYAPVSAAGGNSEPSQNQAPNQQILLEQPVKVRRVTLIGRQPTYSLGVAFLGSGPELDQQISTIFSRISPTDSGVAGIGGGGRA